MEIKKKCLICNENFIDVTYNKVKKFCSTKCRERNSRINNFEKKSLLNKNWKLKNPEKRNKVLTNYSLNNKFKISVKSLLNIDKQKFPNKYKNYCEICKNSNCRIEQHHEDYNKPYEVIALCSKHHRAIHNEFEREIILNKLGVKI